MKFPGTDPWGWGSEGTQSLPPPVLTIADLGTGRAPGLLLPFSSNGLWLWGCWAGHSGGWWVSLFLHLLIPCDPHQQGAGTERKNLFPNAATIPGWSRHEVGGAQSCSSCGLHGAAIQGTEFGWAVAHRFLLPVSSPWPAGDSGLRRGGRPDTGRLERGTCSPPPLSPAKSPTWCSCSLKPQQ